MENSVDTYLNKEFKKLSDDEKNLLLIYKSNLGLLINDLDNNPDYNKYYRRLLNIFSNPENLFMYNTVFKIIDLSSLNSFITSICNIKEKLDDVLGKIVLDRDLTVYRAISSDDEINGVAKSNIISTSLSFVETLKYARSGNNINLFEINLHEGDCIMYLPYSILYDEKRNRIRLLSNQSQDEIILNKNQYEFEEVLREKIDEVEVIQLDAILIDNKKNR